MFSTSTISKIATAGLISKGAIYVLMGILTAMASFELFGKSDQDSDKDGVLQLLQQQTGGKILLIALSIGLVCYVAWRFIQAFSDSEHEGTDKKGIAIRIRYFLSGVAYVSLSFQVIKMIAAGNSNSDDGKQAIAAKLMSQDYGSILVGIAAVVFLAIGIYQLYYGVSEKFIKHMKGAQNKDILVNAGKIGYVARGVVWMLISFLFFRAALRENSNAAGGTSKAFSFVEGLDYGSYLLAAIGLGLICYGIFNFIRAKYDTY